MRKAIISTKSSYKKALPLCFKAIPHKDCASDWPSDFSLDCTKSMQAYWSVGQPLCQLTLTPPPRGRSRTPRALVFLSKYLNVLVFQVKSKIWWKTVVKDLVKHWRMTCKASKRSLCGVALMVNSAVLLIIWQHRFVKLKPWQISSKVVQYSC